MSEISRACKELRDKNILGKDDSGEVDVVFLTDIWIENLIKLPELKKKQKEVLDYL
ncbi:hypothetical protein [Candidatus Nanohalococcus occultus]|uniref:Uncharacterized protein n=1 Tax=Candidatus Nanohalococcus occultus TaxID=2978047 RepID=A0ABY8CE71_9ARCH|nr:hypothetical protein SVXNc_0496 [Candidatus Nanohaloarchaeota archaeon SVXNc]